MCWQERLLMCYAATHPEKLDAVKQAQWQKLAQLRPEDMTTIINLEYLGVPVRKRGKSTGLIFGRKRKRAVRKVRPRSPLFPCHVQLAGIVCSVQKPAFFMDTGIF